jgi:hypothetical protein
MNWFAIGQLVTFSHVAHFSSTISQMKRRIAHKIMAKWADGIRLRWKRSTFSVANNAIGNWCESRKFLKRHAPAASNYVE